jgi:acetyl esterase
MDFRACSTGLTLHGSGRRAAAVYYFSAFVSSLVRFVKMKTCCLCVALAMMLLSSAPFSSIAQEKAAGKNRKSAAADEGAATKQKPVGAAHVYKQVGGRDLKLFILNPPDWKPTDRRPALVFFHGGGWEIGKGGPTQFNAQSEYLVTRGVVCVQVEFRLVADNRKEAPILACYDAKSSMRWVRSHAAELGIDPDRIAAGGGSAGGQLAAFVGMVVGTDDPQDDLKISCRPAAMLLYNPALLHGTPSPDDSKTPVSAELAATYATISPFANVTRDDPPGIILVGTGDNVLPTAVVKAFQEKCKTAGVRMDAVIYEGEGHSFFGIRRSRDRFHDTTIEADKFLASLGWIKGPPTLTREWVEKLAEGVTPMPNKLAREKKAK